MLKIYLKDGSMSYRDVESQEVIKDIFSGIDIKIYTEENHELLHRSEELFDMIFISGSQFGKYSDIIKSKLTPNGKIISFSCDHKYLSGDNGLYKNTDYSFYCWEFRRFQKEKEYNELKSACIQMVSTGETVHSKEQLEYLSEFYKTETINKKSKKYSFFIKLNKFFANNRK